MQVKIKKRLGLNTRRGFSLIELMIAIPIGLLVLFAVLKIFIGTIQSVNIQNAFARVQENGRMATELMARDIRGADYWGCNNDITLITNNLDTADTPDYDNIDLVLGDGGVEGENNVSSDTFSFKRINTDGTSETIYADAGTDIITLRGAQSYSDVTIKEGMSDTSANIKISGGDDILEGDIILISDCKVGDIFTVTVDAKNGGSGNNSLNHNKGNVTADGAVNNKVKILSTTYNTDAQILSPTSKVYFIAESVSGGGINSLYRSVNGTASEMVRGIKDLQIMYGEDTTGNGSADTYSNADGVSDMDAVITIRVSLTSDSSSDQSATSLQRTYTVTTNIRNRTL